AMLAADFPSVQVIANRTNRGFAAANNQGIEQARGRYLLLLNSDTLAAQDALARLVEFMDAHPGAGACGPQLRNIDGTLQPSGRAFPTTAQAIIALLPMPGGLRRALANPLERRDYGWPTEVDEVSGAALCLRRAAIEQAGRLDEDFVFLGEDVDICWRLHRAGWKVFYVPQAVITHAWGASRARLAERTSLLAQRAYVLLFTKHKPGARATLIRGMAFVLTIMKGVNRTLISLLRGDRRAAIASLRLHLDELAWLLQE
ncbi:MAG: glycosyltransferase, partial [Rudaea sp.]